MLSNRLAFAALGIACVAAAAGGGYLASRQNAVPAPVAAISQPALAPTPSLATTAERPVQETEAVVNDAARTPAAAPPPAPTGGSSKVTTPAKRTDTSSRPASRASQPVASNSRPEQTPTLTSSWQQREPDAAGTGDASCHERAAGTDAGGTRAGTCEST
jgi:hypothetical protein